MLTPAPHLPSLCPRPLPEGGTFPSAHCGLTARLMCPAAAEELSGHHSLEAGSGFAKDMGKRFFPPPPAACPCLPASLPGCRKPWHLLGSARSASGWEAQGWVAAKQNPSSRLSRLRSCCVTLAWLPAFSGPGFGVLSENSRQLCRDGSEREFILPGQCLLLGGDRALCTCVHVCTPPWSGRGTVHICLGLQSWWALRRSFEARSV